MRPEQKRVKQLLTEAISLLCRNSLQFKEDVQVEGLLGITLDKSDIFLVSINETIEIAGSSKPAVIPRAEKRSVEGSSLNGAESPSSKKRRKRRSSRDTPSPPSSPPPPSTANVKTESVEDSDVDGRKFNPAHVDSPVDPSFKPSAISTPASSQNQACDNDDTTSSLDRNFATPIDTKPLPDPCDSLPVKQEPEDECYMIDSDSDAGSDVTAYSHADNSQSQSWSVNDQSGFNLSELDMVSAANFHQQFGNLSGMAGGSGIGGDLSVMSGGSGIGGDLSVMSGGSGIGGDMGGPGMIAGNQSMQMFDPSAMAGNMQPGPSGGGAGANADPNQRSKPCQICGKVFSRVDSLTRHIKSVHLQIKKHQCHLCQKLFTRKEYLFSHMNSTHGLCNYTGAENQAA